MSRRQGPVVALVSQPRRLRPKRVLSDEEKAALVARLKGKGIKPGEVRNPNGSSKLARQRARAKQIALAIFAQNAKDVADAAVREALFGEVAAQKLVLSTFLAEELAAAEGGGVNITIGWMGDEPKTEIDVTPCPTGDTK